MAAWRIAFLLQLPFAAGSLLQPISLDPPDAAHFPSPKLPRHSPPFGTEVPGAKGTNKFWANWAVEEGRQSPIHPMPYVSGYDSDASTGAPNMKVSRASSEARVVQYGDAETNGADKIRYYFSPFVSEFGLSAVERASKEGQVIVKEGLFGVHVEVRGPAGTQRKISFPIYSGMSYVSGFYTGFTPKILSDRALSVIERVSNGIWKLFNNGGKEFRLYAINASGDFADDSFDFHPNGTMQKTFEGWIRLAEVQAPGDRQILDFHAPAVSVDWQSEVESGGMVKYRFAKHAAVPKQTSHFAYAHHEKIMTGHTQAVTPSTPLAPPTKGKMKGVTGDSWQLQVNVSEAQELSFLPATEPPSSKSEDLKDKAYGTLQFFLHSDHWKQAMFRGSYYFSGKGFQKVAYTCLLLEKFYGTKHSYTQSCANLLQRGFRCLYAPTMPECNGAPIGSYYDVAWHGVASREGFTDAGCRGADFGNACYNDHHYHFSYFVVSAAVSVKSKPEVATHRALVSFVDTLIRDTTNPSWQDTYFPLFRSFDWFDSHSWSRGVIPSADGKDQESTSEELNLLYGIHLWGMVLQREPLRQSGTTMSTLCAMTIREFFSMTDDNPHHPEDFVRNHATGIFFQNKVDYATWFGWRKDFIHGIQMLPVTPALSLVRTPHFCRQEWDNVSSRLPLSSTDPWTSLVLTGSLAIIEPEEAYRRLSDMSPEHMDSGLTWAWASYWSASQPGGSSSADTTWAPGPTEAPEENSALYRLALASSQLSAEHAAARAVDGLFVTRWSPALDDEEPWISVDSGEVKASSHVVSLWGEFSPSRYFIQGRVASEDPWTSSAVAIGSSQSIRSESPRTWSRWSRVSSRSGGDSRLWESQVFEDTTATTTTTAVPVTTALAVTPETTSFTGSSTTPFYGPNLAFQKPVLSSSIRSAAEHAYKAVDGNSETQWATGNGSDEQWSWVDLLGLYAVHHVVMVLGDVVPSHFVLQTAPDGIKWTTVASAAGASHGFNPPISMQWSRVVCPTACSIRELTVHGQEPGAGTAAGSRVNSALLRPALASSQRLPQHVSRMTDGLITTSWASAAGDSKPWAWVDLQKVYKVSEVEVLWCTDVPKYESQSSQNAVDWTPMARAGGVAGQMVRTSFLEAIPMQWIRIVCQSFSGPSCCIKELYVYDVAKPDWPQPAKPGAAPSSAENLALNKPVVTSSTLPGKYGSMAVDGLANTQWSSAAGDHWIWVDLLAEYQLDHVVIIWGSLLPNSFDSETTSPSAVSWSPASVNSEPSSGQRSESQGEWAQWSRIYCKGGCSIQESQVYGTAEEGRLSREAPVGGISSV